MGSPGAPGNVDDIGTAARLGGYGVLTADEDYLYFSDGANRTVRRVDIETREVITIAGGGAGTAAADNPVGIRATLGGIEALTTDGTTLWISDEGNHVIRAIDLSCPSPTTNCYAVTTVAGSGQNVHSDGIGRTAGLSGIRGLTYYHGDGKVYFVDGSQSTLRSYDPTTDAVVTHAGQPGQSSYADGFGTLARFVSPRYMTSDNGGTLYIADTNGARIRSYNTVTTEVGTFAGDGTQAYTDGVGSAAQVHRPRGMACDGTSIYWVEFNQHTVRQGELANQRVTTLVGSPNTAGYQEGVGASALWDRPFSVVYHFPTQSLYVLDSANAVIRRVY